ncbi:MAG: cytochrome c oxidase subunit II [Candidatus Oxydemutatoraceae bacterium WSBS_2016_MAG_OTU14]
MKIILKSCFYLLLLGLLTPAIAELQPYNMTVGVTKISAEVFDLHMLIFWICVVIGVIVYGAMLYSIIMHRKSRGHKAANFHESTFVEIIWTVVPFIILVGMIIPASKTLIKMENSENADMTIKITGYQWLWEYDYLDEGISFISKLSTPHEEIYNLQEKNENYLLEVDNRLVLPVGKKVRFLITSNDVLHAWWVPALAVKKDAIPGFINESWAKIEKAGIYRGQCAELCGRHHAFMPIVVQALPEEEYKIWLTKQKALQKTAQKSINPPPLKKVAQN